MESLIIWLTLPLVSGPNISILIFARSHQEVSALCTVTENSAFCVEVSIWIMHIWLPQSEEKRYFFSYSGYRLATEPSPPPTEQKCLNANGIKVTRVGGNMFLPLGNPEVEQHKKKFSELENTVHCIVGFPFDLSCFLVYVQVLFQGFVYSFSVFCCRFKTLEFFFFHFKPGNRIRIHVRRSPDPAFSVLF